MSIQSTLSKKHKSKIKSSIPKPSNKILDASSASVSPDEREAEVLHSKVSTAREKSERPGKASATFVEPQCKAPGNAVGGLPSPNAGLSWTALLNQLQVIRVDKSIIGHDVAHPPASVPPPPPALRTRSDENLSAGAGGGSEDQECHRKQYRSHPGTRQECAHDVPWCINAAVSHPTRRL
ncbi:hypothetical protein GLOTRDRAFT_130286 [Gloeophyllum trabeum ATCC 11539]|uniref:Uncharacterized protein n=1 Tax=Gloeophyllum trabeum (strain ATCC 11539 / FP-39264 / Madison 617) TaxID=670483 RepID=S7Q1N1_GLOTA|nr:uncharacterized protein GLOTRDRAFT_130286 [Gloeophyllum trabeum ATCC 11539]EPQ53886.1 hypothetical protein GLOTRDRAFT_130286 [Gloeophyllum trabeum ATCC 11539]